MNVCEWICQSSAGPRRAEHFSCQRRTLSAFDGRWRHTRNESGRPVKGQG